MSINTWPLPREHGLRIAHVFLTHFHADFIAGHLELRDRTGATIYLGAAAKAEYRFTPLHDGDVVEFGQVRLSALETPGHTVESISILVYDLDASAADPQAVLTGDTLFVGDVGRPDLRVALGWSAADLGGMLYDSLRTKLLPLAGRQPRLPCPRRRLALRQGAEQGDVLDDRRAAALELCAAADEQGGLHRARHRGST